MRANPGANQAHREEWRRHGVVVSRLEPPQKHKHDNQGMPNDYFPTGPFVSRLPDRGPLDEAREAFLLNSPATTARAYRNDLEHLFEWCEGEGFDPLKLTETLVGSYAESLQEEGYAKSTIARRLSVLRRFLQFTKDQRPPGSHP